MNYILAFLEGIITFISPCLLPMLPIYIFYFAGESPDGESHPKRTLWHATGFVLGFTTLFVALGVFSSVLGSLFAKMPLVLNLVCGGVVIVIGLSYLGILKLPLPTAHGKGMQQIKISGFFSAYLFGLVFSISWTPCVSAFLGSALMLASQTGTVLRGVLLLLCYCTGLGIPFLISAVLIQQLEGAFAWIRRHYAAIEKVSGVFLILVGVLMATGLLGRMMTLLS